MFQNQGVNKVILVGHAYGWPQWKITGKEKHLCCQLITTEMFNRKGVMEEHTEYHFLRIPETLLGDLPAELEHAGELFIEGKLTTCGSIDADGIKRYDTTILVSKIYSMAKSTRSVSIAT
ncbi:single-stranded DNA-binding protein [Inquilinus sp. KBS0705]|nr:single-stranded DNA-binding protein [Inquilinus sp. KBS0705]